MGLKASTTLLNNQIMWFWGSAPLSGECGVGGTVDDVTQCRHQTLSPLFFLILDLYQDPGLFKIVT